MEEEILFKNTTKLDKECKDQYLYFYYTKYKKYSHITRLVVFLIGFIIYGVVFPIYKTIANETLSFSTIYIGIFCLFSFIVVLLPKRTREDKQNTECNYEFTNEKMIIKTNMHNTQEFIYDKYNPIYKVCEYGEYIYFLNINNTAYCLKKDELIEGKKEDFIKYIKEIYKDKYIDFNDKNNKEQFKQVYDKSVIITTIGRCILLIIGFAMIMASLMIGSSNI